MAQRLIPYSCSSFFAELLARETACYNCLHQEGAPKAILTIYAAPSVATDGCNKEFATPNYGAAETWKEGTAWLDFLESTTSILTRN